MQEKWQSAERESVDLNEKHHEVVKKCDDYVTKITSMEEKVDFLEKQIVNKEKEYSHVGVRRSFRCILMIQISLNVDRISYEWMQG